MRRLVARTAIGKWFCREICWFPRPAALHSRVALFARNGNVPADKRKQRNVMVESFSRFPSLRAVAITAEAVPGELWFVRRPMARSAVGECIDGKHDGGRSRGNFERLMALRTNEDFVLPGKGEFGF